jgi:hypothetical protein
MFAIQCYPSLERAMTCVVNDRHPDQSLALPAQHMHGPAREASACYP